MFCTAALTFKKAIFIVDNGDLLLFQAGSAMHFTMIFVELSIRATHRLIMQLAALHADTLSLAALPVHNAVSTQTAVLVFA